MKLYYNYISIYFTFIIDNDSDSTSSFHQNFHGNKNVVQEKRILYDYRITKFIDNKFLNVELFRIFKNQYTIINIKISNIIYNPFIERNYNKTNQSWSNTSG